jgi:hypothetical protein
MFGTAIIAAWRYTTIMSLFTSECDVPWGNLTIEVIQAKTAFLR